MNLWVLWRVSWSLAWERHHKCLLVDKCCNHADDVLVYMIIELDFSVDSNGHDGTDVIIRNFDRAGVDGDDES